MPNHLGYRDAVNGRYVIDVEIDGGTIPVAFNDAQAFEIAVRIIEAYRTDITDLLLPKGTYSKATLEKMQRGDK